MTETIPEGWSEQKIRDVANVFSGSSAPQDKKYFENGKYPFIRVSDLSIKKRTNHLTECRDYVNELAITEKKLFKAKKGTTVFPKSGAAIKNNNRAELGIDAYIVSHLCGVFSKDKKSINRFIYYILSKLDMMDCVGDKGYPSLKISSVKDIKIILPPLPEQEKIADILSKTDEQIQLTEEIIDKTEEVKKGLMQQLLIKGIGHTEFKEIKILAHTYKIPTSWNLFEINEVLELLTDFEANGSFADVKANVNVSDTKSYAWYVRATDLEKKSSLDKVKYVDEHSYNFLRKTKLFGEEVLITKRGEIGKVYQVPKIDIPMTVAPNTYLLKLNKKVEPAYVYYFFKSIYGQRELKAINRSTTIGAIYKDDVKYLLKLPLPSIKEQNKIAKMFLKMDNSINKEVEELEKLTELKKGLMQDLLSGKVRVKV